MHVNNPLKKVGSAITKAVAGSHLQHEFIVVTYNDKDNCREGYIGIDWSNESVI